MARRGKSGIGGGIMSILVIVVVAAILFSIAKINNINSPADVIEFLKGKSDETSECASGSGWTCNPFGPDEEGGDSGKGNSDGSGESSNPGSNDDKGSDSKPASSSLKTLEGIPTVEEKDVEYARGDWKHWTGSPCNTREEVIKTTGEGVKTDEDCRAQSGTWTDPYTGDVFTDSSKMDLDHVMALGYVAKHGGNGWSTDKKTQFANDKSQLLLVGASPNRAKGDKGPSEWMPSNKDFTCEYAELWVTTADKYAGDGFGLAKADKESLKKTLESCG